MVVELLLAVDDESVDFANAVWGDDVRQLLKSETHGQHKLVERAPFEVVRVVPFPLLEE